MIYVDRIPSDRWQSALDSLEQGGPSVLIKGDVPLGLERHVGWPGADGHVHINVYTDAEPGQFDAAFATSQARAALSVLAHAEEADPRLSALLVKFGVVREYVFGTGSARLGSVAGDGTVTLL